jgi:hypothetical protein
MTGKGGGAVPFFTARWREKFTRDDCPVVSCPIPGTGRYPDLLTCTVTDAPTGNLMV